MNPPPASPWLPIAVALVGVALLALLSLGEPFGPLTVAACAGVLAGGGAVAVGMALRREPPPPTPTLADALADALPDHSLLVFDAAGRAETWNAAAGRHWLPADRDGELRFDHLFQPEDADSGLPTALLARAAASGRSRHEGWRPRVGGPPFWGEVVVERVLAATGEVARYAVFVQDTSDRQRTEELARRHQALVDQDQHLDAANRLKSELLHNVTHELRAPLNAVAGFAELLRDERVGPLLPAQRELVGDVLQSARHVLRLVNDILDLAKIEAGRMDFAPAKFSVAELLEEVRGALREEALSRSVTVKVTPDPEVPEVRLDPLRFKQVLYNYLSNALKFTPPGSTVVVRTLAQGDLWFRVEVQDQGAGIAPADVGRLFVEFQQLDGDRARRAAGTGLGLALVRRVVEAQSGRVGVYGAPAGGAVFFAVYPRRPRLTTGQLPVFAPRAPGTPGTRVLVVEPDPDLAAPVLRTLLDWGLLPAVAESGEAAIEQAAAGPFEGLLLPLLLPDMTGPDLLRALAAARPQAPFWTIVSSPEPEAGLPPPGGVVSVIRRPIVAGELAEAMERLGIAVSPSGVWARTEGARA